MMEIVFIVVMFGGLLVPSAIFSFWWLFWAMLSYGIVFGAYEAIAKAISGMSISQHFWKLSEAHPKEAWIILIMMQVSWLALELHLGQKLIWKGK